MKNKIIKRIGIISIGAIWLLLSFLLWFSPPDEISINERRKLTQFPGINYKSILSGEFMKDFEQYAKDQFPNRFGFRTLKAYAKFYPLRQKDNNDIYIKDGYAVKLEYPLNENSIKKAGDKFNSLYEKYMKDKNVSVFFSLIPDKGYFLSEANGYPTMDYNKLFEIMEQNNKYGKHIKIADILEIDDYYKTDIHWKQEELIKVADKIGDELGINKKNIEDYREVEVQVPFYGVYYGHSALPMKPDKLIFLTNDMIENSKVYNLEKNEINSVYDLEKLQGNDLYDVFLSGAAAFLTIENPNAETDKELVVFRDSFGSSLVPLLLHGYSKMTMIDIRYIASDLIGEYMEFDNQDVLFLYSTTILNSSPMLK